MGVQIEQKSYEMPPRDGFTITLFITVADINRSADFYEKVFGGRVLSRGDSKGASGHIQIANTWLIVNVGGGPTPDKPTVTLSVLADPDKINSFMNIRVADIQACYKLWKSRGARVHHRADRQVRRDPLLHPRSRRIYHRGRTDHRRHVNTVSELELSMSSVQIEQKSYEMPPKRGSASRIFLPSPTSNDRPAITKRFSALAF